jgi:hypothetical protein
MSNWVGPVVAELRCRSRGGVASHDTVEFRIHGSATAVRLAACGVGWLSLVADGFERNAIEEALGKHSADMYVAHVGVAQQAKELTL